MSIYTLMAWRNRQFFVQIIQDETIKIEIPLDDWLTLGAVRYAAEEITAQKDGELAVQRQGLQRDHLRLAASSHPE